MEVNQEYINQNYTNIWQTVSENGELTPYLIDINTPYKYTKEKEQIKISKEAQEKRKEAYYQRRVKEREISRNAKNKTEYEEALQEYLEDELIEFVKKYPQFKDVLQQE